MNELGALARLGHACCVHDGPAQGVGCKPSFHLSIPHPTVNGRCVISVQLVAMWRMKIALKMEGGI